MANAGLFKRHFGADMAEYALVAAGVIIVAAAVFFALGGKITDVIGGVIGSMGG